MLPLELELELELVDAFKIGFCWTVTTANYLQCLCVQAAVAWSVIGFLEAPVFIEPVFKVAFGNVNSFSMYVNKSGLIVCCCKITFFTV